MHELAQELAAERKRIITPEQAGLHELPAAAFWHQKKKPGASGRRTLPDLSGSLSSWDAAAKKRHARESDSTSTRAKGERSVKLLAMWANCHGAAGCTCGGDVVEKTYTCAKYKRCSVCGMIATRACGKAACKQKLAAVASVGGGVVAAAVATMSGGAPGSPGSDAVQSPARNIPRTAADGSPGQDAWNSTETGAGIDEDVTAELSTALLNIPGIGDVTSTLQPPGYSSDEQ